LTNKIPIIKVKSEIKRINTANPYIKDVVCLIGGFETTEKANEVFFAETLAEAEEVYGTDTTIDANAALKQVFRREISGAVIVNISSGSGDNIQRNITTAKLNSALAVLNDIEFDTLYVIEDSADGNIEALATFAAARFEAKKPFTSIITCTRASKAAYETTIGKVGDYAIAVLTQPLEINGEELSLVESGAYLLNTIVRMNVGQSLTAKVLEEVTDVLTVYDESTTPKLSEMVGMGYFVVRSINPLEGTYEVVNSANANGLDMYMTRVLSYIVNEFALRRYLGERNNNATLSGISMECNRLLTMFRDDLQLVENITYAVSKRDAETVDVILNTIEFSGIITEIDVAITIEVV
jgi:hypothetical protein